MKANLLNINGEKLKEIELPVCFSEKVRDDVVARVLNIRKTKQPYSNSPMAGKQASASGVLIHARHVWKSQYGRGMSRVPRKIMLRRGTQFHWVGAMSPNTRGGRRAHGPKVLAAINTRKEMKLALFSAISATALHQKILEKYSRLSNEDIKKVSLPFIVESKITSLKTKELLSSLKKILGKLSILAIPKKEVRSGKGKMRGRKYKKNAGMLLVTGKDERIKTTVFDVKRVQNLSIKDLAKGGSGRLTVYTDIAIKELNEKFGAKK